MRRGSQNRAAVERSSRKLLLFWEERVCEDMENLQNEYGNTIGQGLCVVKYFELHSRGENFRAIASVTSRKLTREAYAVGAAGFGPSASLGTKKRALQRHGGRSGDREIGVPVWLNVGGDAGDFFADDELVDV